MEYAERPHADETGGFVCVWMNEVYSGLLKVEKTAQLI